MELYAFNPNFIFTLEIKKNCCILWKTKGFLSQMFIEMKTAHNSHFNSFRQMLCTHKNFNWDRMLSVCVAFSWFVKCCYLFSGVTKKMNWMHVGSIDSNSNFVSTSSLLHDEIISDNFIIYVINNFFSIFSLFRKYMYICICVFDCFFFLLDFICHVLWFFFCHVLYFSFFFIFFFFYIFRHFW